jgi:cyclophilin family peptidyl-prolyl cis-trans isomerase/protein-disulfide isomerase
LPNCKKPWDKNNNDFFMEIMPMRRLSLVYFILVVILTSCSAPAAATTGPETAPVPTGSTATPAGLGNCIDARQPTPDANGPSLFPPVNEKDHILGSQDAYVTVLVYSDFQCASCAKLAILLKSLQGKYPENIRVVFRPFPLISKHDKSALSTQAAEAAGLQGKFWGMHDFLFTSQAEWQNQKPDEFQKWLVDQSTKLGLDKSRFEMDLSSPEVAAIAQKAWDDGLKIQLPGAPIILVNGEIIKWQSTLFEGLESVILLAMLPEKQFNTCPPVVIDLSKQYNARLKTSKGELILRLFTDKAPNTVNNFIFLAKKGWYENVPFHLVVPGFMARTGDPSGTGLGGPGYFIPNEIRSSLRFDRAGMVGMVNSGRDTNGSQFFITLGSVPQLNNNYTLFGQVTNGMEVLSRLTPRDPSTGNSLSEPDLLISVTIEEK